MAPALRQAFPVILATLAGAVYFSPELNDEIRSIGTSGLWMAAMIWSYAFEPKLEPVIHLPRIIWEDRDGGEKFSIVMFHLLIAAGATFFASQMVQMALAGDGNAWMAIPAAAIVVSTGWLIWSNWKNRNAR